MILLDVIPLGLFVSQTRRGGWEPSARENPVPSATIFHLADG